MRFSHGMWVSKNDFFFPALPCQVTINSLVNICVRCGDLDRAYSLLKDPSLTRLDGPKPSSAYPRGSSSVGSGVQREAPPRLDPQPEVRLETNRAAAIQSKRLRDAVDGGDGRVSAAGAAGARVNKLPATDSISSQRRVEDEFWSDGVIYQGMDEAGRDTEGLREGGVSGGKVSPSGPTVVPKPSEFVAGTRDAKGEPRVSSTRDSVALGSGEDQAERDRGMKNDLKRGAWAKSPVIRPSVGAFTSILAAFAGIGDKDRALGVFQQVKQLALVSCRVQHFCRLDETHSCSKTSKGKYALYCPFP